MTTTTTSRDGSGQMPLDVASAGQEVTIGAAAGEGAASVAPPRVIGIDLSLKSTGVAGGTWAETLSTWSLPRKGATRGQRWERLLHARSQLLPFIDGADLVVQESPAYSTGDLPGSQDLAWLWWSVYGRCASREIPWAEVSTGTLKVYATGRGTKVSKEDVVQEVQRRRPDVAFRGNDQADALVLAAMGLDALGFPPVAMPQTHRRALASVLWPWTGAS
jgi:crossover junction endodeoxyribonuclease RuvC